MMPDIFDKPPVASMVLAEAVGCSQETAREGILALIKAGYVIAPREPTNGMLAAYLETYTEPTTIHSTLTGIAKARARWKAMADAGCRRSMSTSGEAAP